MQGARRTVDGIQCVCALGCAHAMGCQRMMEGKSSGRICSLSETLNLHHHQSVALNFVGFNLTNQDIVHDILAASSPPGQVLIPPHPLCVCWCCCCCLLPKRGSSTLPPNRDIKLCWLHHLRDRTDSSVSHISGSADSGTNLRDHIQNMSVTSNQKEAQPLSCSKSERTHTCRPRGCHSSMHMHTKVYHRGSSPP
jgi:hypothetical protein